MKELVKAIWNDQVWSKVISFVICGILGSIGGLILSWARGISFTEMMTSWMHYSTPLYITLILIVTAFLLPSLYSAIFHSKDVEANKLINTKVSQFTFGNLAQILMRNKIQIPDEFQKEFTFKTLYEFLPYFRLAFRQGIYLNTPDPQLLFALAHTSILEQYELIEFIGSEPGYYRLTNLGRVFLVIYDQIELIYGN